MVFRLSLWRVCKSNETFSLSSNPGSFLSLRLKRIRDMHCIPVLQALHSMNGPYSSCSKAGVLIFTWTAGFFSKSTWFQPDFDLISHFIFGQIAFARIFDVQPAERVCVLTFLRDWNPLAIVTVVGRKVRPNERSKVEILVGHLCLLEPNTTLGCSSFWPSFSVITSFATSFRMFLPFFLLDHSTLVHLHIPTSMTYGNVSYLPGVQ